MNIVSHEDLGPDEHGMEIERVGGPRDGQRFWQVKATLDDGSIRYLWVSNAYPGYFEHAFVPHGFKHPQVIVT